MVSVALECFLIDFPMNANISYWQTQFDQMFIYGLFIKKIAPSIYDECNSSVSCQHNMSKN